MKPARHGKKFDVLMWTPLAAYLVMILALLSAMMARITWPAVKTAFSDDALLSAIRLSLETSFLSAFLSVSLAIPAGYALSRSRFPGLAALDTILDLPIVLPPLIIGLAVLIFFSSPFGRWLDRLNGAEGWIIYHPAGIVLVQFLIGAAIATRVVKAGFDNVDERYENVAWTLGANRWQAFAKVAAPLVWPNVAAAAVISWARIFGLFGPVLLVAGTMRGHTEIMPTTIFLEISIGRLEVALVVGAMMVAISMATLLAFKKLGGKGYLW
jgi:molybdate transport system permease protein